MLIPKIVYEDSNIIICNKPAGILSQPDRSLSESLLDAVKSYRAARGDRGETHIINRLDRPVAGLVLFACNAKTAALLSALSGDHSIEKCYYAVVKGRPYEKGEFTDFLIKDPKSNTSRVVKDGSGGKKASLSYKVLGSKDIGGEEYSLVEIKLRTGRHHQIRVQFSSRGYALYGDIKYNPDFAGAKGVSPALFAYRLAFNNPYGADRISVNVKPEGRIWEFEYFNSK